MVQIDGRAAIDLLREAVKSKGEDYIYDTHDKGIGAPTCVYVEEDRHTPSCLVGHALVAAGADPNVLRDADESIGTYKDPDFMWEETTVSDTGIANVDFNRYLEQHGIELSGEARVIFDMAQHLQDSGKTWGEALAEAESIFR